MCKGKGVFKKLLAVAAIAGGAIVLFTKLKKGCGNEDTKEEPEEDEEGFEEEQDMSARNYVSISHGEEASDPISDSEESLLKETGSEESGLESEKEEIIMETEISQEPVSKAGAPSSEEIAAKLEQAVAETEARYEEAAKEAAAADVKKG